MPKIGSLFRNGAFENAETPQLQLPQEKAFVYSTSSLEPQMILLPPPKLGASPSFGSLFVIEPPLLLV